MSNPAGSPRYITPVWPDEPFFLLADEGWTLGPFEADDFNIHMPDGSVGYAGPDKGVHLKVRQQKGDLLSANDGSVRRMTYRIVPVSKAPRDWNG